MPGRVPLAHVVGVDFGALRGGAAVVRAVDAAEVGPAGQEYARGVIGPGLPPRWAVQDRDDGVRGLKAAVPEALRAGGAAPSQVGGSPTDFPASTPLPVL